VAKIQQVNFGATDLSEYLITLCCKINILDENDDVKTKIARSKTLSLVSSSLVLPSFCSKTHKKTCFQVEFDQLWRHFLSASSFSTSFSF